MMLGAYTTLNPTFGIILFIMFVVSMKLNLSANERMNER